MTDELILYRLIETAKESRRRTAEYFPLPDVDACIDYAITEAAEYLDAYLRAHRAGDKRRQDKDHSMVKEWGQCGYMLASAAIQTNLESVVLFPSDYELFYLDKSATVYELLKVMCDVRQTHSCRPLESLDLWACFAMQTLHVDPVVLMKDTCWYFENKFMPQAEVGSV